MCRRRNLFDKSKLSTRFLKKGGTYVSMLMTISAGRSFTLEDLGIVDEMSV